MKRRTFLGTIGIGVTTIAGCLSRAESDSLSSDMATPIIDEATVADPVTDISTAGTVTDRTTSSNDSTTNTTTTTTTTTNTTKTEAPQATPKLDAAVHVGRGKRKEITLGDGSISAGQRKLHGVILTNSADLMWTATLSIRSHSKGNKKRRRPGDSVAFEAAYELEPRAVVDVSLTDPGQYAIEVTVLRADTSATTTVGPTRFGCSHSSTTATIQDNGSLGMRTTTTWTACPSDNGSQNGWRGFGGSFHRFDSQRISFSHRIETYANDVNVRVVSGFRR